MQHEPQKANAPPGEGRGVHESAELGGRQRANDTASARFNYSGKLAVMHAIARDPRLLRSDVAVLSVIVDHANEKSGKSYPSVDRIARDSLVPKTTVLRSLKRIEDTGWVRSEKRHGAQTVYWLSGSTHGTSSIDGTSPTHGTSAIQRTNWCHLRRGTSSVHGANLVPSTEPEQGLIEQDRTGSRRDAARPPDPIWGTALSWLKSTAGIGDKRARTVLGDLRKQLGSDDAALLELIETAKTDPNIVGVEKWLYGAAKARAGKSKPKLVRPLYNPTAAEAEASADAALGRLGVAAHG